MAMTAAQIRKSQSSGGVLRRPRTGSESATALLSSSEDSPRATSDGGMARPDVGTDRKDEPPRNNNKWSAEDDTRRLELLNKSLLHTKHVTSKIVNALEEVEERISQVEHDISAIYKVTSRLRTTNNNVTSAIASMDAVFRYFYLESEISQVVHDGPGKNLVGFLEQLSRLDGAILYFEQDASFKSSEAALRQLRQLRATALESCEHLYTSTLEKCSAPLEASALPSPLPKELDLIETRHKERLLMLSEVLSKSPTFMREFCDHRGKFFVGTVRKLPAVTRRGLATKKAEATPSMSRMPQQGDGSAVASAAAASSSFAALAVPSLASSGALVGETGEDENKLFGEFTLVFLRLAEHERRLAAELFGDGPLFSQAFSTVLEGSLDLFVRLSETTIKTRPRNVPEVERLFYLLDTYDELSGRLKGLNQVTRIGEGFGSSMRVQGIVEMFRSAVKSSLTFFLETVQRDNIKVGNDGNVHALSSRTLNYLIKRLLPRRTCVEFLVDKWLDVSTVTLQVIILTICNELCLNLEEKARRVEKKQPILANVFLLNNYHYILHTVSNNNMLPPDLLPTFSASYETKIFSEIAKYRASWNQTIEFLQEPLSSKAVQLHTSDYKHIKANFSGFNKALEKLYHAQKLYTIPNNNLRSELRELAKSIVVPLYKSFLARYAEVPFSKNRSKYEQYTSETLVQMLDAFFQLD